MLAGCSRNFTDAHMSPFSVIMAPLNCFRRNLSCMAAGDQGLQLLTKQRGILCLPWGFSFDFVCFCLLVLDLWWMILHMPLDYNKARLNRVPSLKIG